ncbi:MAG TPA: helix-turn-helix transcriptional regulator [Chloroflexota bacterium]|jgi:non-specific serine/threonine protein kinase|nr:helix-turn-helix transcriptional regulator [Chloroflexota bacterium]
MTTTMHSSQSRKSSQGLSRRELQVARLIVHGASNRQIATLLVLSERTVDTHVGHILRKLQVASRAQIAAWVVRCELDERVVA